MIVESVLLRDFRNYQSRTISFSPATTIIVGPNASGKTNIMEALHMLATGKSFRAESDREMIAFGNEMARVKGIFCHPERSRGISHNPSNGTIPVSNVSITSVEKIPPLPSVGRDDEDVTLEIVLTQGNVMSVKTPMKKYLVNNVARRAIDFVGNFRSVLFWPQNLELVTDSPSTRRRYLDSVLVQVDREYRRSLGIYEKAVRQRNRLLEMIREGAANRNQLAYWDSLLIHNGSYITAKRAEYVDYANRYQAPNYLHYQLVYDASSMSEERLGQYKDQEVAAGVTLVGPHRDDIQIKVQKTLENSRDIKLYGSRGEQRMAVLWLALCELAFIEEKTTDCPVLLLDDIFSELDLVRRKLMTDIIGRQQTVMTTTDLDFIDSSLREKSLIHTLR